MKDFSPPPMGQILEALQGRPFQALPAPPKIWMRASVAIILVGSREPSLCIIKRAKREGDPWSGHMAFPGGRASPSDRDAVAVAIRENQEEVGLTLEREQVIGRLDDISLSRRARRGDGVLSPVVFHAPKEALGAFILEPKEVAAAHWITLEQIYGGRHEAQFEYLMDQGESLKFPGIAHDGEIIWGLTYRVLQLMGEPLGLELPPFPDF